MKVRRGLMASVLIWTLLCSSLAEEDPVEKPDEATALESKIESKEEAKNQTGAEPLELLAEVATPVNKDDLITVKKAADPTADVELPPWDPRSALGKPPPTRPPYK